MIPSIISGALSIDDRGTLTFFNGFNVEHEPVKRMYLTENHQPNFVRAWHAHKHEAKFVMAVSGSALVCAVKIINWKRPRKDTPVHRFTLSASSPLILCIPAGYANGWMSLTGDAKLLWFSSAALEESKTDDVRFPARYWNSWKVEER